MANSNGTSTARNMVFNGRTSILPPKSPFPCIPSSLHPPGSGLGSNAMQKQRDAVSYHQRTSSDFLIEEKPSWLDDLLDEPETPLSKGCHRRSSSDSFAYSEMASYGSMDSEFRDERTKSKQWDATNIAPTLGLYRDAAVFWSNPRDSDRSQSRLTEKKDLVETDTKGSAERNSPSDPKSSETENKRTKQQYAQRSRVRRLQYIAELERTVQALQAEGSQVSAEIEFMNQKNFILSMENKALKQRLEGLAQEQHIKYMEHDVLEREVGRLKNLCQKQQHSSPTQRLSISKDLEKHFASLALKTKEANGLGSEMGS